MEGLPRPQSFYFSIWTLTFSTEGLNAAVNIFSSAHVPDAVPVLVGVLCQSRLSLLYTSTQVSFPPHRTRFGTMPATPTKVHFLDPSAFLPGVLDDGGSEYTCPPLPPNPLPSLHLMPSSVPTFQRVPSVTCTTSPLVYTLPERSWYQVRTFRWAQILLFKNQCSHLWSCPFRRSRRKAHQLSHIAIYFLAFWRRPTASQLPLGLLVTHTRRLTRIRRFASNHCACSPGAIRAQ